MENTSAISMEHYYFLLRVFEAGYCYPGAKASEGFEAFLKSEIVNAKKMTEFIDKITPGSSEVRINGSDLNIIARFPTKDWIKK